MQHHMKWSETLDIYTHSFRLIAHIILSLNCIESIKSLYQSNILLYVWKQGSYQQNNSLSNQYLPFSDMYASNYPITYTNRDYTYYLIFMLLVDIVYEKLSNFQSSGNSYHHYCSIPL